MNDAVISILLFKIEAIILITWNLYINTPRNKGLVQAPRPNAGRPEKTRKNQFFFRKKIINTKKIFFLDIPSSYAKILGETNFQSWEIPRRGSFF